MDSITLDLQIDPEQGCFIVPNTDEPLVDLEVSEIKIRINNPSRTLRVLYGIWELVQGVSNVTHDEFVDMAFIHQLNQLVQIAPHSVNGIEKEFTFTLDADSPYATPIVVSDSGYDTSEEYPVDIKTNGVDDFAARCQIAASLQLNK